MHAALQAEHPVFVVPTACPTISCSRITLARQRVKRSQRPFSHELAEMVRYAVGYRSRAFVLWRTDRCGRRRSGFATRRSRSHPRRHADDRPLYKVLRRPSSPRPCDRRSRGASSRSAPIRSSRRSAPVAPTSVSIVVLKQSTARSNHSKRAESSWSTAATRARSESNRAALLRPLARASAQVALPNPLARRGRVEPMFTLLSRSNTLALGLVVWNGHAA